MPRAIPISEDSVKEKWEMCVDGVVAVWTYDKKYDRYDRTQVGNRHSRFLYITTEDRQYNQEQIPDECKHLDPFTNGALRLVSGSNDRSLDTSNHLDGDDLLAIVRDRSHFAQRMADLGNELLVRRLLAVVEDEGTAKQLDETKAFLRERYPIGGGSRAEVVADPH
jgi:hypothetical protein